MNRSFFGKYFSIILIGISIVLGIVGYSAYYTQSNIPYNFSDIAFAIIQLFPINGSFEPTTVNIPLNIARFLAPLSLASAIVQGFLILFSSRIKLRKIRRYKGHTIICGDAANNIQLARNLEGKGNKYVLLNSGRNTDKDVESNDPLLHIQIDQFTSSKLDSIGFYLSRYFIVSFENDTRSLLFVKELIQNIDLQKVSKPIDIIILFNNPEWNEYSADLGIIEQVMKNIVNHKYLNFRYLNYKDAAIRKIMISHAPDVYKPVTEVTADQLQICIIGMNKITERLIINLAVHSHYLNHKKLHIHLFPDCLEHFEQFEARYQLNNMLDFTSYPAGNLASFNQDIAAVYLTEQDETEILKAFTAFQMNDQLSDCPKIVLSETSYSVASLIRNKNVMLENIADEATVFGNIIDESIDRFAEIIHNDYLNHLEAIDPNMPTQRPWHTLSDEIRNRNRVQADHIIIKLRSLGCTIIPKNETAAICDFSKDHRLEDLSKTEHDRWSAYLYYKGWKPGKTRDDSKKVHTDLIPYEDLSEVKKTYDRNTILNIPNLINELGYVIIQNPDPPKN